MKKRIAVLGSTGSIGKQVLEVVSAHKDLFEAEVLTAYSNSDLLIQQAIEYQPNAVVIADESQYEKVKNALSSHSVKVFAGEESLVQITEMSTVDMVVVALVGFSGLKPTCHAIKQKKPIALANKETLVAAGEIVMKTAAENQVPIIPIDSEHSAIFQCLAGEFYNKPEAVTITASGGPFFGKKTEELQHITPKQALKHPNWVMGNKITIDSATLMNKGLEMIEAKWLFNMETSNIRIVVHPQSIVHSLVHFQDGSIKAQLGLPDMRVPIQYAMSYPCRLENKYNRFSFTDYPSLTFFSPDTDTFRCLSMAYRAIERGGNIPCCMNAANEMAVAAFLEERLSFLQIAEVIEETIQQIACIEKPSLEDCFSTDKESRRLAKLIIENKIKKI
jgi:1-deoxy-D-xylulose-5-phosphate reductoisomerase